jgi:hypothetical protein
MFREVTRGSEQVNLKKKQQKTNKQTTKNLYKSTTVDMILFQHEE